MIMCSADEVKRIEFFVIYRQTEGLQKIKVTQSVLAYKTIHRNSNP